MCWTFHAVLTPEANSEALDVTLHEITQGQVKVPPESDKAVPLGLASIMVPHDPSISAAERQKAAEQQLIINITG